MENDQFKLPENAQRELKPGEEYEPILSKNKKYQEVTVWSVCIGLLMTILFSAAAAYLGLKVGQVFEAAIPIAIIAIGLTGLARKNDALSQNVIIQSIGGCSGGVVAGAIFTLPALYILQGKGYHIEINFWQVFIASLLGGILGILFLIPFRKYFVKEQHGKFPFPEATATTQVLVSGQKKGKDSLLLVVSGLIGGLYDFIVSTFGWWSETLTTRMMGWGAAVADKAKLMFKVNTGAAVLGLGYIIGLKYAFIICCGSMLVWFIIIPGMNLIWGDQIVDLMNAGITATIGSMAPEEIFKNYARHIGIGGIAMAGVISIIKSWGVIKSSVGLAANEFKGKKASVDTVDRTQQDIPMKTIVIGIVAVLIVTFLFFWFGVVHTLNAEVYVAPKPDDPTPDEPTYKDGPQLYNMGFDLWSKEDGYDVCYGAGATADEKATWGSANKTTAMLGLPTVGPEKSFLAVEGEGKTALKLQTRSILGKLAAGSLFNGELYKINIWTMSAELLWGIPFTQRPKVLDGYACYQPKKIDITQSPYNDMKGKLDNGSIAVYLTDWPEPFRVSPPESLVDPENDEHIIGYGKLIFDKEMDKYEPFRLEIKYRNDRTPKYVTVVISSSALGDYFTGGEGTVFYLDEFKFLY